MAKKIIQSNKRKINNRIQGGDLSNDELKTLAMKKVRQLQNGKRSQSKISKRSFGHIENRKQSTRVQKQLFEQILDESVFQCPVCLQLMIEPTLLQCGHAYCFKCLEELMIYKSCCGVCRNIQNQPEFQRSKHLQTMIESMILKKSQNYLEYYCRVTDTQNWKRVRNISIQQLGKGVYIDFRDKELKWRKAQILKITYNQISGQYDIVVKYKKDGQIVQQMIQSDSGRYTKFSYYTRMKYLQPRSNCNAMMEQFVEGEVMDIPFIGVELREENGEIDLIGMAGQEEDDNNQSNTSNIELQNQTSFQNYYYVQNEFLDQLFNNNNENDPTDLIQLLA